MKLDGHKAESIILGTLHKCVLLILNVKSDHSKTGHQNFDIMFWDNLNESQSRYITFKTDTIVINCICI